MELFGAPTAGKVVTVIFAGLLSRLQNRQIGWPCAIENTANVDTALSVLISIAGAIADEATGIDELTPIVDCRHPVALGESNESCALVVE